MQLSSISPYNMGYSAPTSKPRSFSTKETSLNRSGARIYDADAVIAKLAELTNVKMVDANTVHSVVTKLNHVVTQINWNYGRQTITAGDPEIKIDVVAFPFYILNSGIKDTSILEAFVRTNGGVEVSVPGHAPRQVIDKKDIIFPER